MDTRTFLGRVLPKTGNYVISVHKPDPTGKNPKGFFWNYDHYTSLDDMAAMALSLDRRQEMTVYFAVGSHVNNEEVRPDGKIKIQRLQETADKFRAVCFDLDIGPDKPYKTRKEGAKAMLRAFRKIGLPDPMIVASGRGLHVYFPLDMDLPRDKWEKLSIALRLALVDHDIVIDFSKIHDPSMVLRPVGCHHKKDLNNWKQVHLLADCPTYTVEQIVMPLKPWFNKAVPNSKSSRAAKSSILSAVLNSATRRISLDSIVAGCNQLAAIVNSGGTLDAMGNKVEEPMWRLTMGVAKFTTDPQDSIIRLAGQHPDFDLVDSTAKMDGYKGSGLPFCATIEKMCPGGCNGCALQGQGFSPGSAIKGESVVTDGDETFVPPWPYLIKNHEIWRQFRNTRKVKDEAGKTVEEEFDDEELVCPYLLRIDSRYTDVSHNASVAVVSARYPVGGWKQFDLPLATLSTGGAELAKIFGDKQLFLSSAAMQQRTRDYLMSYLKELQRYADTSYKYSYFGWQPDGTFLVGRTLIGADGERDFKLDPGAENVAGWLIKRGSLEKWVKAMQIFDQPNTELHAGCFLLGAGGILLEGSSVNGFISHLYGPETGSGKTSTINAIASIWGDPADQFLTYKDTDNYIYKTAGVLNSIPLCMDEVTHMVSLERDRARDMVYQFSQGKEKGRLGQDANQKERASWRTSATWTSNADLYTALEVVVDSEGPKARVFQAFFARSYIFDTYGRKLFQALSDNCGHAGELIVQEIIKRGGPRVVYDEYHGKFSKDFNFKFHGTERFIEAGFVCAYAIGCIMHELGLISFDVKKAIRRLIQELQSIRSRNNASAVNSFDLLGMFLLEHNDRLVHVRTRIDVDPKTKTKKLVDMVVEPTPDRGVARMEMMMDPKNGFGGGKLYIAKSALKWWCEKSRADYTNLLKGLADAGVHVEQNNQRVSIMKGCNKSNPGQAHCIAIDLSHPEFQSILATPGLPNVPQAMPRQAVLTTVK